MTIKLKKLLELDEIGDSKFPLVIDKNRDIVYNHPLVGQSIFINSNANEVLKDKHGLRGNIVGVIIQNNQIAGFKINVDGKIYYAPKKDFFIGNKKQFLEDVYLQSLNSVRIREQLKHFDGQHDYMGTDWSGVEKLNWELAKLVDKVCVEFTGWYKYKSSKRPDMDGKDWRLVTENSVVVNCHSLLHDNTWTLTTTVFDTKQIDIKKLKFLGHRDHWLRSMLWTLETAKILQTDGYNYSRSIQNFKERMKHFGLVHSLKNEIILLVRGVYRKYFGKDHIPEYCSVSINEWNLVPDSVGSFTHTIQSGLGWGIIAIHPKVFKQGMNYLKYVLIHELIHSALGKSCTERDSHDEKFRFMADKLGLPKKYQD